MTTTQGSDVPYCLSSFFESQNLGDKNRFQGDLNYLFSLDEIDWYQHEILIIPKYFSIPTYKTY